MIEDEPPVGTADICDEEPVSLQVMQPILKPYGGRVRCSGEIVTVRLDTGNHGLKELLRTPGEGRVAVVDVGGRYFSVVGDRVGALAHRSGWQGLVIHGYVRDSAALGEIPVAVWALGTYPQRGPRTPGSARDVDVSFGGVVFRSGAYLYADEDGLIVVDRPLDHMVFWD